MSIESKERLIEVKWDNTEGSKYSVKIKVIALDKAGYLAEVTKVISKEGFNLNGINAHINKDGTYSITLVIKVEGSDQLEKLYRNIKKIKGTIDVFRVKG